MNPMIKVIKHLDDVKQWLDNKINIAVDNWFKEQCKNTYGSYFLFYKAGEITITEDIPEGFTIASFQRILPSWTKEKARCFCYDVLQKCPCLPDELLNIKL
jgi:hypothetical protein